jgi:hypothetical protein
MSKKGQLVRNTKGQFVKGNSGGGRPKGSKNQITVQKLMLEEAVREDCAEDIEKVLKLIIGQALEGDKPSQKMIWDSAMSKQTLAEDKAAGKKQQITVHTMNVEGPARVIEGDFDDITENEETLQ